MHPGIHSFVNVSESLTTLGSYGSLPNPVRQAANELTALIERNPDKFMRQTYLPLLTSVRGRLANFIGAESDEVVLVPNASHGINTVLKNFEWQEGDILIYGMHNTTVDSRQLMICLSASTTYSSIFQTIRYISDTPPHPQISEFKLEFPTMHAQIISSFRDYLQALPRRSHSLPANNPQKIVAVIDSIASKPGVLLPWKEMVATCREEGVWSVIDAAQSIGQEVNVDVGASGCDFWISVSCAMIITLNNQKLINISCAELP
jgi:cysteine sulfinate desulfinase/cysteine desulfurase-like protein